MSYRGCWQFLYLEKRQIENNKPLQDYTILNIQHQLGDVTAQTEALIALGALPSNRYFLPPPYTHHREFELFVFKYYGISKENFFQSSSYRLRYNYDKCRLLQVIFEFHQMIKIELSKKRQKHNNLLVLDDGGYFSEALTTLLDIHNEISIETRLIEQTSHGMFKYVDQQDISKTLNKFGISIIDVASSESKKRLEPTIIAEACLNMLSYLFYDALNHLRVPKPLKSQNCLLLGYGQTVGYALTDYGDLELFSKYSVKVWDRDVMRHKIAENNGFEIFNQWNNKEEFDYIIGCTGRCSLPLSSLSLLRNNCYLISVSSAAIEFPFNDMIEHSLLNGNKNLMKISLSDIQLNELNNENIHRNITFQIKNQRNITIVNGGMPITFLGILNPVIPEKFDLTVSCMIAVSIQAVSTEQQINDKQQIIPLDSKYSKFICN
ncbi:unnamed protein product [Didymodactylos carnosus]|uniref:Uncharacterized protein n=2 Tax=Didymodactylos carnosus TaxID=1234261 RepID=A0A813Q635_9BILA|nr:unnamed protein product [Didymodactylos carnosus]CAF3543545.1 unnamed protein product [Didymodactylos carnosus]